MREEDKNDAEEVIKYLQDNSNVFSKKGYEQFPWLKSDKGKKTRIISELASKDIFDKECTKTGRPKLAEKGWKYFEQNEINKGDTYNFGDNTFFQSELNNSNVVQDSFKDLKKPSINKQTTQATQPHQSPLKNQTKSILDSKPKSNIPVWVKSVTKYIIVPLLVLFIWWLIVEYVL